MIPANFRAWITLAVLSFIYFLENYDRNLISVSPIPYIDYDSYKYSLLSGTLFAIVYTMGGLFFSLIRNLRSSRVNSIAFACVIFSVALFCTTVAKLFWQQAIIRMVMGLAQSVVTPFASGIIGTHFDEEYRGIAFSVFNIGVYISFSLILSLGTYMYDKFGWKMGYFVFGLLGIALGICTPFLAFETGDIVDNGVPRDDVDSPLLGAADDGYSSVREKVADDSAILTPQRWVSAEDSSVFDSMRTTLLRVLRLWRQHPALYILCLATGLRMAAGYVWSAYTSVYFAQMYVSDSDESGQSGDSSDCVFSFNDTYTAEVSGDWGMGGAALVRGNGAGEVCDSSFPYCFLSSGECRDVNTYPWHNEGMDHSRLQRYMSWVPLVGSGLGSMLGGHLSDKVVGNKRWGLAGRPFVAATSSLVSIPFVIAALLAGYPDCFLYFIPSGLTGEMYIGASLAMVADLTPPDLVVPSVALFMFFVTLIGGNGPLLVPLVADHLMGPHTYHTFRFTAAVGEGGAPGSSTTYAVEARSGYDLQEAMIYILCSLYFVSALVYYCSACVLLRKQENTKAADLESHRLATSNIKVNVN